MRGRGIFSVAVAALLSAAPVQARDSAPVSAPAASGLASLFADWRKAAAPDLVDGVPDYRPAAIARLRARLMVQRSRLAAAERGPLTAAERIDARLIAAEMNGLAFQLDTLKPWARDPDFYQTVWAEQSDVPGHEGPYAPVIDLWGYDYPLKPADAARLAAQLRTVAPLLQQARANLADSTAHDLFAYGARAFHEQAEALAEAEAGTLMMRSLAGLRRIDLSGAGQALLPAIREARQATEDFARWVEAEAPRRTGPSGVGVAAYDWAARNVYQLPYDWAAQELLLQRELDRAWAGLALEEAHNKGLPPLELARDAATFDRLSRARAERFAAFLIDKGFVPEGAAYRAAIPAQLVRWTAPEKRNFFAHVVAVDPLPLYSHFFHWMELARLRHDPLADPVRQGPLLYNIWQDRAEGTATAMEEIAMQAGLYDDLPRARELVWIMLANRAARGLASLYVQANRMTLAEAGRFHARWTPRGWSDPASPLVAFEQLLYARQPGYGTSYIIGKVQLDDLIAREAERASRAGRPFDVAATVRALTWTPGTIPFALIAAELPGGTATGANP